MKKKKIFYNLLNFAFTVKKEFTHNGSVEVKPWFINGKLVLDAL